jgi:prepilin-type N-terminal cleavage/methylation domain-containing protein
MNNESGFTIIELLIATAVFSIILLITASSIIGISNTYVKGQVTSQTQQSARAILTDISQAIEFNNNITFAQNTTSNEFYFCVGSDIYVYQLDTELESNPSPGNGSQDNWALLRYSSNGCPSSAPTVTNGQVATGQEELLANNERLGQLSITPINLSSGNTAYQVSVTVGYGADDLLDDNALNGVPLNGSRSAPNGTGWSANDVFKYQCQSGSDSNFCDVSTLTTTIEPRIND